MQERLQILLDDGFIQGAGVPGLDHTIPADEEGARDAAYLVCLGRVSLFIQQYGERQPLLFHEAGYLSPRFRDVDGQDDEVLIVVVLVGGLESGPLSSTVRSPGRPEVEQHDLALQLR